MRMTAIAVLLLMPASALAQNLQEIAERLERASLLADALKDQLTEMKSGAEVADVDRAAVLLEVLRDELPTLRLEDGQTLRVRSGDPGFRALYTADRDGSNVRFLTVAPGMIASASPSWSPSGTMIAFDAHPELGRFQQAHVFIYAVSGPFTGTVKDLGCGNVPVWSPDETQIAFMLNPGNPDGVQGGIWVMNSDGTQRRRLCSGWYPSWSPDGKSICVQSLHDNPQCPHVYDLETGRERSVLGEEWSVTYSGAAWSPDGQRLIFVGRYQGKQHLATVDVSGEEETVEILYTEEDGERELHGPPAWSPDGTEVVISVQNPGPAARGGAWQNTLLYRVNVERPHELSLFEQSEVGVINRGMAWSPDGTRLVFSSERMHGSQR